jgi:multidrug efflux pump subunit AcrA (membrane-fusion protein)
MSDSSQSAAKRAAVPTPQPAPGAEVPDDKAEATAQLTPKWRKYLTPILVLLLAAVVVATVTRSWNSWVGDRIEQVTDDAYVHGDITPLGTKVAGIVREVRVSDYQQVHKGDLLVELEDNDFQAQVAQAKAAVDAARANIEDNVRQRQLQDADIQKALAGIDQAKAQIAAAQAGKEAVETNLCGTALNASARRDCFFDFGRRSQEISISNLLAVLAGRTRSTQRPDRYGRSVAPVADCRS